MYKQYLIILWSRDLEKNPHFKCSYASFDYSMERVEHYARAKENAEHYKNITMHEVAIDEDNPAKMAITFLQSTPFLQPKPPVEYNKPMKATE